MKRLKEIEKMNLINRFIAELTPSRDSSIEEVKAALIPKLGDVEGAAEIADSIIEQVFKTKDMTEIEWQRMSDTEKKASGNWRLNRYLPRSGMKGFENKAADASVMSFVDDQGQEHRALKLGENLSDGQEDFSVGRILAAKATGNMKGLNDFERKQISEGTGSAGGFLLSEDVSAQVIDMARNLMAVQKAGAKTINMSNPTLRLVKIIGNPTATFRAENQEITESEWSLDPINLKAMSIGVLCRASKEILEDAQNAGSQLSQAMAQAIALAMDLAALTGDGVSQPRGLDHCDDVNVISMGTNGAALTNYDEFSEAAEGIADHNGIAKAVIYSPRTHFALDRLKAATTNQPLIPPQSFIDLKKYHTNQIPNDMTQGTASNASSAFIGDFSQLLYGIRKSVEIEMSNQADDAFKKVNIMFRATMRFDIAILRPNHFTKISGIIPA